MKKKLFFVLILFVLSLEAMLQEKRKPGLYWTNR